MKKILIIVLLGAVLAACNQILPISSLKPVGTAFTLVFDGLGTTNFNASLSGIKTQALTDQQATVKPIRVIARGSMDYIPVGQPRSSGFRYVYAVLAVNSTANLENVSFLGVRSVSSIADTAISAAIRASGGTAFTTTELETLALSVKPAQASNYDSITKKIVPLPNTEDTVQYLPESALDFIPEGMAGLLPYGFTVLNSTGGRSLETTTNANRMVVSMKVPLAADPINDPYAFAFSAVPVSDSETRVTQTLEAQSKEGNAAVVARALALGTNASITALPSKQNSPASPNTVKALCSVRTAGSATSPTSYLINRTSTSSDLEPAIRVISKGQVLPTSVWVTSDGGYYLPAQITSTAPEVQIVGSQLEAVEPGVGTYTADACGSSIGSYITVINPNITVDAGYWYSLGIKSDDTVVAWGSNIAGETTIPNTLSNVISVSAGFFHNLALKSDGTVAAWGLNSDDQTRVPNGLSDVIAVAAGGSSSLALKNDGTVIGWGCNCSGQVSIPTDLTDVVAISVGSFHSLALKSNGTVVAWGGNDQGQTTIPNGLSNVIAISAGGTHNLVLKNDGSVIAWGNNNSDQTNVPNTVGSSNAIGTGTNFNLSVNNITGLIAWGDNTWQQLDIPSNLTNVLAIQGGDMHALALKYNGSVIAWGTNFYGQTDVPDITPLTFKLP